MCLATRYDKVYRGKVGYKILRERWDGSLFTGMYGVGEVRFYEDGYTVDPNTDAIPSPSWDGGVNFTYPAGFHVFTRLTDARKVQRKSSGYGTIYKVAFRNVVAYGEVGWRFEPIYIKQNSFSTPTVVATQCRVIRKV